MLSVVKFLDLVVTPSGALGDDAKTIIAALYHAGIPLTPQQLGTALAWTLDRVIRALQEIEAHPAWLEPMTLQRLEHQRYGLSTTALLTPGQRESLQAAQDATQSHL